MPKKGYTSITIDAQIAENLNMIKDQVGLTQNTEVLRYIIKQYLTDPRSFLTLISYITSCSIIYSPACIASDHMERGGKLLFFGRWQGVRNALQAGFFFFFCSFGGCSLDFDAR